MPRFRLDILKPLIGRRKSNGPPGLIIVGLGNSGPEYRNTRHNAGFWCIDWLARRHGIKMARGHRTTHLGEGEIVGQRVVLSKPRTFVNRTGQAAAYLLARYRVKRDRLLFVYDDTALPPGKIRLRPEGSAGGHNGIKSIISSLGTQEFARLRIGVGQPESSAGRINHVLGEFRPDDKRLVVDAIERAAEAIATILTDGVNEAMNRHN
jgi:PTH1 family peptidyl-tRNA hydrolase